VGAAAVAGGGCALILAFLVVTLRANQIVSGLALTIFAGAAGLSSYIGNDFELADDPARFSFEPLNALGLGDLPVLGPVVFEQTWLVYASWLAVAAVAFYLWRTRPGLNVRAVGESPAAADAMGIDVTRYRYLHTVAGGALAGIGGACFSLALTPQWVDGLTAGAGWIAIALVIFAFWRPDLCLVGAYVFGGLSALPLILQARGAGARLDRDRPTAPRRPGRARHPVRARRTLGGRGGDRRLGRLGHVAPDRLDDLGPVEQAGALLGALQPVHDVAVLEDLRERAAAVVLADDVLRHALLAGRALEQEREDVLESHWLGS
jgi:hypothetical protein